MTKLLIPELVCLDVDVSSKEEIIRLLAEKMDECGRLNQKENYISAVLEREATFTTAVGFSVATPHAKTDAVKVATLAFARLSKEISWDEDENVNFIFQIAVPTSDADNRHLQILAGLSRRLMHEEFRNQISNVTSPEELTQLIGDI